MKTIYLFILGMIMLASCSVPPGIENEEKEDQLLLERPQNALEGNWIWIITKGEGIAGPYQKDSISEGYSMRYDFVDNNNLVIYRNEEEFKRLEYFILTMPEEGPDGTFTLGELRVTGKDSEEAEEPLYWNWIDKEDQTYLYIQNYKPGDVGTDNQYSQQFQLINRHDLNGSY